MVATPLKNQIIQWLKGHSYWLQYSGNRLLEGEQVTDSLIDITYQLFKEDHELLPKTETRIEVMYNEIAISAAFTSEALKIQKVKDVENVNALASGQSLDIHPNLTIIYGGNGTGKSGYIRLLNNVFPCSRGDKKILPNVFVASTTGEPECKFTFQSGENIYDIHYPTQKSSFEFSQYSVFDSHSIKALLEQNNRLNFTPAGFEFFEKIMLLFEKLKANLDADISINKKTNEFAVFFTADNPIRSAIINLGAKSDETKLRELSTLTADDTIQHDSLNSKKEELKALNVPEKILQHQKLLDQLEEFKIKQGNLSDHLKVADILEYKSTIESYISYKELAKQEGIKSLEDYNIESAGSEEWKSFIKASKAYSLIIEKQHVDDSYPSNLDSCLFCLRPLAEKEMALIRAYWKLLKSESEGKLNQTTETIRQFEKSLKGIPPVKLFEEGTIIFEHVIVTYPDLAKKWKDVVLSSEASRQNIITNLHNKNLDLQMHSYSDSLKDFDQVALNLSAEIKRLSDINPTSEIAKLDVQIQQYLDKKLLNTLLDKLLEFISSCKWEEKATRAGAALNTKFITVKQGEFFSTHITDSYTANFNSECAKLNAPKFVQITQKNAKGTTLRKLEIAGRDAHGVLSEGEQRAISLADFLTEVELNPNNKGVFFDDPITSQDHIRREQIAGRLVQLSENKQVIIFTHDVAFFVRLKILAEKATFGHAYTTLRNTAGIPGVVDSNVPWIAQPVKSRMGTLKDKMVRLQKLEKDNAEEEYLEAVKGWYTYLREAWERAVEERLFKGVVERFSPGVSTLKLKKVIVTQQLLDDIEKGMTESSNWVHDSAAGLNPTTPDTLKAQNDLDLLQTFLTNCPAA